MSKMTRRTFVGGLSSASAASLLPGDAFAKRSPNETPNLAAVGVGGKGWVDSNGAAKFGNIVAFCDVEQAKGRKRSAKKKPVPSALPPKTEGVGPRRGRR